MVESSSEFGASFKKFMDRMVSQAPAEEPFFRRVLSEHLKVAPNGLPVVSETFQSFDHPNLQLAIDHLTGDELISAGYDEEKARQLVTSWKQFLEDNQDEITALQILYNRPHAKRHLVYEELKTLAEAVARPPTNFDALNHLVQH